MKTKSPKKRAPQDATLRNIRALKTRVAVLEDSVEGLEQRVDALAGVTKALRVMVKR